MKVPSCMLELIDYQLKVVFFVNCALGLCCHGVIVPPLKLLIITIQLHLTAMHLMQDDTISLSLICAIVVLTMPSLIYSQAPTTDGPTIHQPHFLRSFHIISFPNPNDKEGLFMNILWEGPKWA